MGLEGSVPSNWTGSTLSISPDHYKMGTQSVKWNWNPGAQISIDNPSGMATACHEYKGGMMLWIYNEVAKDADLTFEYKDASNTVQYHFNYHLNFTGWRACWIRFDEDMYGSKANKNLATMHIKAPTLSSGGVLYFDRMKFPSGRVHDRVTPDAQLPYINPDMNLNHWAALWHWYSTYIYETALPASVTTEESAAFAEIRSRISSSIIGNAPSSSRITAMRNEFAALNIQRNGDNITGNAFVSADEYDASNNDKRLNDLDALIYDMAKAWHHNQEAGFDQMIIDMLDWLYDQGLAVGSGLGTNHHYGYQFRNFPKAIFLMKEMLKTNNKLQPAIEMLQYWTGIQEMRQSPGVENFQGIVDTWNTKLSGRLMAILLPDDSPEVARDMEAYSNWVSAVMQHSVGTKGGIKPDGSGFHHGMHYAGYLNGGYSGLGDVLRYVGGTMYNLSSEARANFKKGLLVHMWTANERSFVSSISGRHPLNQNFSNGVVKALGYLAKASSPIDQELAGQYMRLASSSDDLYIEFQGMGVRPSIVPVGNKSINYAALNLHRRDNWLVATKGFNKIVTGTEIYTSNNRYGRYQSYGTVQVLASGNPVSAEESGFVLNGWDWNRFSGATTIHLPYDKLNYSGGNLNERSHNEEFAGACSLEDNGIWGMKLDENNYTNYTDDFVARKSVFAFDNRIILLGSGISNSNSQRNTETTLFQSHLANTFDVIRLNDEQLSQFPLQRTESVASPITILDTKGIGYYLPMGTVNISKANQESRNNKNKAVNNGDFASAWIDHGKAPTNAEYEYAMLIQTSSADLNAFKADMALPTTAPYEVKRKDNIAHIVKDKVSQTTGYVLFEAADNISDSHIKQTNYPCLVMVKDVNEQPLKLSMSDPAINMEAPASLVHDAIAQEREVQIVLNGRYSLVAPNANCQVLGWEGNTTRLSFTCIHGLPVNIELEEGAPLLANMLIDGANPNGWSPDVVTTSITIPESHSPVIIAEALNSADQVSISEPASYPGDVTITVTNSKETKTVYTLSVNVAQENLEDFENFLLDDWVNTSYVGNNNIIWYVHGKRDSHLGTGVSVYSYNTTDGVWSEPIAGGISTLSFDALDKWAVGKERTIEVKINGQVVKTEKHTGAEQYVVSVDNLTIPDDAVIGVKNISATKAAVAIDNIRWTGYAQERNAYLSSINVNRMALSGFNQDIEKYDVLIDSSEAMPVVEAFPVSVLATVQISYPASIPGNIVIKVSAEDGSWKGYILAVDFSNSIDDDKVKHSAVYPNPVSDQLFIQSDLELVTSTVYSLDGRVKITDNEGKKSVQVGHLNNGVYCLHLTLTNGATEIHKFIKK